MICPPGVFDAAGALFYRNAANGAFMFTSRYRLSDSESLFQTASMYPDVFKPRPAESHKGTYGTLAVIGGAEGMSGAVVLAATAAAYTGCGKVWAGFNQRQLPFAVIDGRPEIMLATAHAQSAAVWGWATPLPALLPPRFPKPTANPCCWMPTR
mgnify:CR=1 FL=1